jgi:hypothetical protein
MHKKLLLMAALVATVGVAACTAEVEDKGQAPEIEVKGGEMPEVDVDPARVEVGTDTQTIITPDVDVTPTEGDDK